MVRHDTTKNTIFCDACKYRVKLYSHNSLIISQELSNAKAAHECADKTPAPLNLDQRWSQLLSGI